MWLRNFWCRRAFSVAVSPRPAPDDVYFMWSCLSTRTCTYMYNYLYMYTYGISSTRKAYRFTLIYYVMRRRRGIGKNAKCKKKKKYI